MGHIYTATSSKTDAPELVVRSQDELRELMGRGSRWRCIAGPFTLPHEEDMVLSTVAPLKAGGIKYGVFNVSKFGHVVEVWREAPPKIPQNL